MANICASPPNPSKGCRKGFRKRPNTVPASERPNRPPAPRLRAFEKALDHAAVSAVSETRGIGRGVLPICDGGDGLNWRLVIGIIDMRRRRRRRLARYQYATAETASIGMLPICEGNMPICRAARLRLPCAAVPAIAYQESRPRPTLFWLVYFGALF